MLNLLETGEGIYFGSSNTLSEHPLLVSPSPMRRLSSVSLNLPLHYSKDNPEPAGRSRSNREAVYSLANKRGVAVEEESRSC